LNHSNPIQQKHFESMTTPVETQRASRIRLPILLLAAVVTCAPCGTTWAQPEDIHLSIWTDGAPVGDGTTEKVEVPITVHRPAAEKANGTAIVICPGGGYGMLVRKGEGHEIANWLTANGIVGIVGIVLEYRLPKGRPYVPLLDAWQKESLEWLRDLK
jgi:acetyl esterase/lipase